MAKLFLNQPWLHRVCLKCILGDKKIGNPLSLNIGWFTNKHSEVKGEKIYRCRDKNEIFFFLIKLFFIFKKIMQKKEIILITKTTKIKQDCLPKSYQKQHKITIIHIFNKKRLQLWIYLRKYWTLYTIIDHNYVAFWNSKLASNPLLSCCLLSSYIPILCVRRMWRTYP